MMNLVCPLKKKSVVLEFICAKYVQFFHFQKRNVNVCMVFVEWQRGRCVKERGKFTHTQKKDTRHMSMKVEYLYSTEGTANPDTRRVKTEYCHYSHKQITTKRTSKTEQNTSKSEFLQKKKSPNTFSDHDTLMSGFYTFL